MWASECARHASHAWAPAHCEMSRKAPIIWFWSLLKGVRDVEVVPNVQTREEPTLHTHLLHAGKAGGFRPAGDRGASCTVTPRRQDKLLRAYASTFNHRFCVPSPRHARSDLRCSWRRCVAHLDRPKQSSNSDPLALTLSSHSYLHPAFCTPCSVLFPNFTRHATLDLNHTLIVHPRYPTHSTECRSLNRPLSTNIEIAERMPAACHCSCQPGRCRGGLRERPRRRRRGQGAGWNASRSAGWSAGRSAVG